MHSFRVEINCDTERCQLHPESPREACQPAFKSLDEEVSKVGQDKLKTLMENLQKLVGSKALTNSPKKGNTPALDIALTNRELNISSDADMFSFFTQLGSTELLANIIE